MRDTSQLTLGDIAPSDLTLGYAQSDLTMGEYATSALTLGQEMGPAMPAHMRPAGAPPPIISDSKATGVRLVLDETRAFSAAMDEVNRAFERGVSKKGWPGLKKKIQEYWDSYEATVVEYLVDLPEDTPDALGKLSQAVGLYVEILGKYYPAGADFRTSDVMEGQRKEAAREIQRRIADVGKLAQKSVKGEKTMMYVAGAAALGLGALALAGTPRKKKRKKSRKKRRR